MSNGRTTVGSAARSAIENQQAPPFAVARTSCGNAASADRIEGQLGASAIGQALDLGGDVLLGGGDHRRGAVTE